MRSYKRVVLFAASMALASLGWAAAPPNPAAPESPGALVTPAAPATPEIPPESSNAPDQSEPRQSLGAFASDTLITTKVKAALLAEMSTNLLKISVETVDRVVTLAGKVKNSAQIDAAVGLTRGVDGVKDVVNDLEVEPH